MSHRRYSKMPLVFFTWKNGKTRGKARAKWKSRKLQAFGPLQKLQKQAETNNQLFQHYGKRKQIFVPIKWMPNRREKISHLQSIRTLFVAFLPALTPAPSCPTWHSGSYDLEVAAAYVSVWDSNPSNQREQTRCHHKLLCVCLSNLSGGYLKGWYKALISVSLNLELQRVEW